MNRLFLFLSLIVAAVHGSLVFQETFEVDPFTSGRWSFSKVSKYNGQPVKVMASQSAPSSFEKDNGVQLTKEMKHYGFGSAFAHPIHFSPNEDLVVQYELKFEESLSCGGAYIKLLREPDVSIESLDSQSPYTIMFGPDKCGSTNKVHFIVQHQNPVTKEWQEKHFNETIPVRTDQYTHLYTLVLRKDQHFDIYVDEKLAKSGSLLTHLVPSINPPEFIDDPEDHKPSNWVDAVTIADATAVKPDDWDEEAPRRIPDPAATKPASWLDDAPLKIPNPDVAKPEDWDDDEDGEWEAPLIDNPECEKVGCGPWSPPLIANPAYKGKWAPPQIANPEYKGEWKAKQVPNPAFFVDNTPLQSLAPLSGLAVEVWTTNGGIHFDNFVVGSVSAVHEFTRQTFEKKSEAEHAKAKADQNKNRQNELKSILESGSLIDKAQALAKEALAIFQENPIALGVSIAAFFVPFVLLYFFSGSKQLESKEQSDEDSREQEDKKDIKREGDAPAEPADKIAAKDE